MKSNRKLPNSSPKSAHTSAAKGGAKASSVVTPRAKNAPLPKLPDGVPELHIPTDDEIEANIDAVVNEHLQRKEWRWQELEAIQAKHQGELDVIRGMDPSNAPKVAATIWQLAMTHRWEDWKIECLIMEYVDRSIRRVAALLLRQLWIKTNLERLPELTGWAEACGLFPRPVLVAYHRHLQNEYWGDSPHQPTKGTFPSGQPEFDEDMGAALNRISEELYRRECARFQRGERLITEVPFPPGRGQIEYTINDVRMLELIGKRILGISEIRAVEFGKHDSYVIALLYPYDSTEHAYPHLSKEFMCTVMCSSGSFVPSSRRDAYDAFCRAWFQIHAYPDVKLPSALIREKPGKQGESFADVKSITPIGAMILRALYNAGGVALLESAIADAIDKNEKTIRPHLKSLKEAGHVEAPRVRNGYGLTSQGKDYCDFLMESDTGRTSAFHSVKP